MVSLFGGWGVFVVVVVEMFYVIIYVVYVFLCVGVEGV